MPLISHALRSTVLAEDATNSTAASEDVNPFNELIPAIIQCFVIMLGGYIAGRLKIISPVEAKGLNMFVSYAALPALIFLSLATLDFSNVNWMFLIAVFISKTSIFLLVAIITSVINWPQNFGKAGIYGIACTQSNDFALGYPIIAALYSKTNPEYASYLYLVAPISLCFLNPLGFILLEIDKERSSMFPVTNSDQPGSSGRSGNSGNKELALRVFKGVVKNPIVIMTFSGIIYNFIFGKYVPVIIYSVLQVTGSAFSATSLFLLGLNMVGKIQALRNGNNLLLPLLLIVLKIVALPLIIKEVISILGLIPAFKGMSNIESITEFGFLYGTFPTAPTVFVFASAYGVAVDVVASAMSACTFLSAPLMFISAKMISLDISNPKKYYLELDSLVFYLSIVSLICCLWVLLILFMSKKHKRVPHVFTILLIVGLFMAIAGTWIGRFADDMNTPLIYARYLLIGIGLYSMKFMATVIAISTALLRIKSLCLVLKMRKFAPVLCFAIPIIIFVLYSVFTPIGYTPLHQREKLTFIISRDLAAIITALEVICLIVTLGATVMEQYYSHKTALYQQLLIEDKEDLMPERERKEIIKNSIKEKNVLNGIKVDRGSRPRSISTESYKNRRDEILCENFGICKRRTYKDQLLVTGYDFKKRKSIDIENLGFQFSLRGLGLPVGADKFSRPIISEEGEDEEEVTPTTSPSQSIECAKHANLPSTSKAKQKCQKMVDKYQAIIVSAEESHSKDMQVVENDEEHEYNQHLVLVIYLCLTMLADISSSTCILLLEKPNGIYIELEFLNAILCYSIGIVFLILFGTDIKLILIPMQKLWRKSFGSTEPLVLPELEDLDDETIHICEQFCTYHIDKCIDEIVKDTRWRLRLYKSVFYGKELVSWLIQTGLAQDRQDGIKHGRALLNGRIIKQFNEDHHFHDSLNLYVFNANAAKNGFENPRIITMSDSLSETELSSS